MRFARTAPVVELDRVDLGELVASAAAATLDVRERAGRSPTDAVVGMLGDRRCDLVLDNCEHVVDAAAELAYTLLVRCPRLRIIATSRQPLLVNGEVVLRLDGLPSADAERLFRLRAGDVAGAGEICRRLDGLPLAIELAAGRASALPVAELLVGLDQRLGLLAGARTGPDRHRDIRATVQWSHRLLTTAEQTVFRRLSVLAGPFGLDAATAVAVGPDVASGQVFDIVCALVEKSLVVADSGRFRLLAVVRAYGRSLLEQAGELTTTRQRAMAWLVDLVAARPLRDQLLRELADDLVAAVPHARGRQRVVLTVALARLWLRQGNLTQARALVADVPADDAELLAIAARLAVAHGEPGEGLPLAEKAVDLADPTTLPAALDALSLARQCSGDFHGAVAALRQRLELLDDALERASCQHTLAWELLSVGDVAEAKAWMDACMPVIRRLADPGLVAAATHTQGAVALATGDVDAAEERFADLLRTPGIDGPELANPLEGLAIVADRHGDHVRTLRLVAAAEQARRRCEAGSETGWQRRVDEAAERAKAGLGAAAARSALAAGRQLSADQAIAYALDDQPEGLTSRELQVAKLVAEGLTDRQIGIQLGISAATVQTHLNAVRNKSGLRTRAQIAVWVS